MLATGSVPPFRWAGPVAIGRKCHCSRVPCASGHEVRLADFLDAAPDVKCYLKNERLGFAINHAAGGRVLRHHPGFVARCGQTCWLLDSSETDAGLVRECERWCSRLANWRYLAIPAILLEEALASGIKSLADLAALALTPGSRPGAGGPG